MFILSFSNIHWKNPSNSFHSYEHKLAALYFIPHRMVSVPFSLEKYDMDRNRRIKMMAMLILLSTQSHSDFIMSVIFHWAVSTKFCKIDHSKALKL